MIREKKVAYHCRITDASRDQTVPTITFQVFDDSTTPPTVIEAARKSSYVFDKDVTLTTTQRNAAIRAAIKADFDDIIGRLRVADADFTALQSSLVGLVYP